MIACGENRLYEQWLLSGSERLNMLDMPLQAVLSQTARVFPDKTVITYGVQKVTYRQLDEFSNRFANALVNCGVKKGSRVALFLLNSPQFVVAYFGVLKAGAVVTVVSPLHKELELEQQLCDSGAEVIVVLESLFGIVKKVMCKTLLKTVIVTGEAVVGEDCFKASSVNVGFNVFDFSDLIKKSSCMSLDFKFIPETDLAVIQYTSGTAGVPKGVMLSHTNLVSNVLSFSSWINGTFNDVFLSVLPFFHVYGMTTSMLVPISLGAEMVLLSRFDPVECLCVLDKFGVSVFCGSSIMFSMLSGLELERYNLSGVRVCISGASRLFDHVQERFMRAGVFLVEGYGLTEASPVTHCTPIDRSIGPVKIGSVGLALPGTEVRIVDVESGCRSVAVGERGELCVRGLQVMRGYWQNSLETYKVLRDGWLFTGDIVYMDSDGYMYIVDRKKDLLKCRGYSVCPRSLKMLYIGT